MAAATRRSRLQSVLGTSGNRPIVVDSVAWLSGLLGLVLLTFATFWAVALYTRSAAVSPHAYERVSHGLPPAGALIGCHRSCASLRPEP
jgi:hypothetical protein